MKRYQQLAAAGLDKGEILSLIGNGGTIKVNSDNEDKVDFPEWAKDQSYESWKIEFDFYKNSTLGNYKNAEIISETNRSTASDLERHKSDTKIKILEKIRHKLVASLKKCENEKVKDFVVNSVMNNTAISNNLDGIMENYYRGNFGNHPLEL